MPGKKLKSAEVEHYKWQSWEQQDVWLQRARFSMLLGCALDSGALPAEILWGRYMASL